MYYPINTKGVRSCLKKFPNAGRLRYQKRPSESDSSDGRYSFGILTSASLDVNVLYDQLVISIGRSGGDAICVRQIP